MTPLLLLLLLSVLLFMPKHRFTPSEEQQLTEALSSHKKPKQIQKELFPDLELNVIRNKINRIRSDKNTDRPAADASDRVGAMLKAMKSPLAAAESLMEEEDEDKPIDGNTLTDSPISVWWSEQEEVGLTFLLICHSPHTPLSSSCTSLKPPLDWLLRVCSVKQRQLPSLLHSSYQHWQYSITFLPL